MNDINFEAKKGEIVGLVGINGSGKSTLLNIIADRTKKTSGEVSVNGKAIMVSAQSNLNREWTGRKNINKICSTHGLSKDETEIIIHKASEFSNIGDFLDLPVNQYALGMKTSLELSLSIMLKPEILIIDEGLSVSDNEFYTKCIAKFKELKETGTTILFATYSMKVSKELCDKIVWLEQGNVKKTGIAEDIIKEYEDFLAYFKNLTQEEREAFLKKNKSA